MVVETIARDAAASASSKVRRGEDRIAPDRWPTSLSGTFAALAYRDDVG